MSNGVCGPFYLIFSVSRVRPAMSFHYTARQPFDFLSDLAAFPFVTTLYTIKRR